MCVGRVEQLVLLELVLAGEGRGALGAGEGSAGDGSGRRRCPGRRRQGYASVFDRVVAGLYVLLERLEIRVSFLALVAFDEVLADATVFCYAISERNCKQIHQSAILGGSKLLQKYLNNLQVVFKNIYYI